jgi:hypothetical protein
MKPIRKSHPAEQLPANRFPGKDLFIILFYLLAPFLFYGLGKDLHFMPLVACCDAVIGGVPASVYSAKLSLWNPHILSGAYSLMFTGSQTLYPPGILVMKLFPNLFGSNLLVLSHYSIAGVFSFLFLRRLSLIRPAAFIGALSFMFCGFLSAHKMHYTMLMSSVYLPVILYFFESFIVTRKLPYLFGGGMAFGLSILADYLASPMYIGMVVFPYIVFRIGFSEDNQGVPWKNKFTWMGISLVAIFGAGVMLAMASLAPMAEAIRNLTREKVTYEFFASFSFPLRLLPIIIFPHFFGASPQNSLYPYNYFGPPFLRGMAGYMGIMPLLSAILAFWLFRKKNRQVYFWFSVAIAAFLLVLGNSTPFYQWLYYVPIYNLFRVPPRNWLEANFAVAVLFAFFIHYLADLTLQERKTYLKVLGIVLGFFALIVASMLASPDFFAASNKEARLLVENVRLTSGAVYIPLLMMALSGVLLYLPGFGIKKTGLWAAIAVLIFADLFSFGYFIDSYPGTYAFFANRRNDVADFLSKAAPDKEQYRILTTNMSEENTLSPNTHMLYGFNAANAYGPAWLKNYQKLTSFDPYGNIERKQKFIRSNRIMSVLSIRYLISSDPEDQELIEAIRTGDSLYWGSAPQSGAGFPIYSKRYVSPEGVTIYENLNFLPRARFVEQVVKVRDASQAANLLWAEEDFDPSRTALIEGGPDGDDFDPGEVVQADYSQSEQVTLDVRSGQKSFLVLADSWYPGWKAYVDGKEVPIYRAYAALRGIQIDGAGEHRIEFKFTPWSFYIGLTITCLTLIGILIVMFR